MKLILFGGAEVDLGQVELELKQIGEVINQLAPKQVLHIPFARTGASGGEWNEKDWFRKYIHAERTEYLNAENREDIEKATTPLVFLSGGGGNMVLLEKIKANEKLLDLILNASCIIGESAGAKILGAYFRAKGDDDDSKMIEGLGIIRDAVIEPHYTEKKRQDLLLKDMKEARVHYGIGIDCLTAIEFEVDEFPKTYKKIGSGTVAIRER